MTSLGIYEQTPHQLTLHRLERQGCHLHYWLGGDINRPLIVLMHGGSLDHRMFNPQVTALLSYYRVLVWDCRGHGKSQPMGSEFSLRLLAEDMLAILKHENIQQAVIGGQSMGGMIAQELYRIAPELFLAMLIIDSTPISKAYSRLDVWATRWSVPILQLFPYGMLRRFIANTMVLNPQAREYGFHAIGQMSRQSFMIFWSGLAQAITREGIPNYQIHVPMLLMHGDRDRNGTIVRDAKDWAQSEPDVKYVIIPNAAHNANQDNPDYVNETILTFLSARVG